jgi:hypothetical protein
MVQQPNNYYYDSAEEILSLFRGMVKDFRSYYVERAKIQGYTVPQLTLMKKSGFVKYPKNQFEVSESLLKQVQAGLAVSDNQLNYTQIKAGMIAEVRFEFRRK